MQPETPRTIYDLETPSVLIDLDIMERNIQKMQQRCNTLGKNFRAHIKTHKIPDIAKQQIAAGAVGIACQKVSEAEVFAQAGITNIQLPYNIIGERKLDRLMALARDVQISVSTDHADVISGLEKAAAKNGAQVDVLVDVATAIQRTGAGAGKIEALAQQIVRSPNLRFGGLLVYPTDAASRPMMLSALAEMNCSGIAVKTVSGGGMGGAQDAEKMPEVTELRVGTYVFNDWRSWQVGYCGLEDCAMHIIATVVSRPTPDRAILDSGSKTLSSDTYEDQYGYIVEYPAAKIYKLNEEHAYCDLSACEPDQRPKIGDQVRVIPVHTCVVSNLHNQLYGVRGENIEVVWPVTARGLVW